MNIYVILLTIRAPGTPAGCIGCNYFGYSDTVDGALKMYNQIDLTPDIIRKEIWSDNGMGYRKLLYSESYHA